MTDILNEYIIRGSERMLDLTDPERREISNLVRSSPDVTNFDTAREKVVRNFLGTVFKTKQHTTRKTTQTPKKKHRRYANYYTKFIAMCVGEPWLLLLHSRTQEGRTRKSS